MILDEILAVKRWEVESRQAATPLAELERKIEEQDPALDFVAALRAPGISVIGEVKRGSPSKGTLRGDLKAGETALSYAAAGAAAVSVLTDETFFKGSLADLVEVKEALRSRPLRVPVLRKDFVIAPYQVYEARAYGADAVLLIVAALEDRQILELLALTRSLGMAALVEAHDAGEVERAVASGAQVIGINNRDLRTFAVDIETTARLAHLVPEDRVIVSESGIHTAGDVDFVARCGVDAALVGEALVTAGDPAAKIAELTGR
ncbi:MAG: indole-3-glycerol phosphate synthase TrpC [Chloroflexi bacterium]|nr:indole-3-glycerol phosphate synthase TrpC [Chloroflexota bacterium]